ncbi:MAG: hypothetical protein QF440_00595 [Candidatus Thalassarchaeaceae archaeon]|nr:hypothetical protein [Candidatus Thalassarchaeaceae archaeon]
MPSIDSAAIFATLRDSNWIPMGTRIIPDPSDASRRLIPIIDTTPQSITNEFPVIEAEQPKPPSQSYRDHLAKYLDDRIISQYSELWPTRHEIIGDLILVKIPEEIMNYQSVIGQAMLHQHTRIRLVLRDDGVAGEYRVRQLIPLAERVNSEFQTHFTTHPETLVQVKESGIKYWTDPSKAYFSGRLSTEREGTISSCFELSKHIGHKLRICDPYAGVGPALVHLLATENLVEFAWGSDLNIDAVELMKLNLKSYPNARIECTDAQKIVENQELVGTFDVLLINIPHSIISHLPKVIPLLKENSPTLLRGWIVIDETDISITQKEIAKMLPEFSTIDISIRRSYSSTQHLCRFEAKLNH